MQHNIEIVAQAERERLARQDLEEREREEQEERVLVRGGSS
jgi:hypothetical protein